MAARAEPSNVRALTPAASATTCSPAASPEVTSNASRPRSPSFTVSPVRPAVIVHQHAGLAVAPEQEFRGQHQGVGGAARSRYKLPRAGRRSSWRATRPPIRPLRTRGFRGRSGVQAGPPDPGRSCPVRSGKPRAPVDSSPAAPSPFRPPTRTPRLRWCPPDQEWTPGRHHVARVVVAFDHQAVERCWNERVGEKFLLIAKLLLRGDLLAFGFDDGRSRHSQPRLSHAQLFDHSVIIGCGSDPVGEEGGDAVELDSGQFQDRLGPRFVISDPADGGLRGVQRGLRHLDLAALLAVIQPGQQLAVGHKVILVRQHLHQPALKDFRAGRRLVMRTRACPCP